jgi:hypothetical protein
MVLYESERVSRRNRYRIRHFESVVPYTLVLHFDDGAHNE